MSGLQRETCLTKLNQTKPEQNNVPVEGKNRGEVRRAEEVRSSGGKAFSAQVRNSFPLRSHWEVTITVFTHTPTSQGCNTFMTSYSPSHLLPYLMAGRLSQPELFQKPYSSTPLAAATVLAASRCNQSSQLVGKASHLGVCCLPSTSLHFLGRRRITTVFICTSRRELPTSDGFGVSSILLHPGKPSALSVACGVCFPQGSGKEEWWAQG